MELQKDSLAWLYANNKKFGAYSCTHPSGFSLCISLWFICVIYAKNAGEKLHWILFHCLFARELRVFDFLPLYWRAFGASKFRDEDDFKLASEKSKIRRLTQKWHLYV